MTTQGDPKVWQRFTPAERIGRSMVYIGAAIAVVWSARTIEIIPEFLYDAPQQTADLFHRMWPFDFKYWPFVWQTLVETFHIATLGTILAIMMALPLAFLAARNFTSNAVLRWIAQFIFVSSRSVNSLIWALLFVAIFGPGAVAGVLSIAVRSIGFVGKLFGEALEEAQTGPIEALTATGASKPAILIKGYWPQAEPAFWSVALLRWDINIRESAVLGLVGAGGIGVSLDAALNNLYWDQVGLILATILAVVIPHRDRNFEHSKPNNLISDSRNARSLRPAVRLDHARRSHRRSLRLAFGRALQARDARTIS